MAVRINATNEYYEASLSLGVLTQMCVSCWFKISTDRNTYSTPWCVDNFVTTSSVRGIQTGTNGTTVEPFYHNGPLTGTKAALTVGTWYYLAYNVNGNNGNWRYRADGGGTVTATSFTGASGTFTASRLRLGESTWGGEWLNGCIAAVKIWTGNLSAAEMDAEAATYTPIKTAGLVAWYPFHNGPDTTDYSGNGHTLVGGSGTSQEAGPNDPVFALATDFQGWGVPI
uniref:LamG-like jellyroll fold domain-containing protein n=1 Tax=Nonomuraea sp. CA-251285 TaxID=3240002 RepID=UPI003F4924A2